MGSEPVLILVLTACVGLLAAQAVKVFEQSLNFAGRLWSWKYICWFVNTKS